MHCRLDGNWTGYAELRFQHHLDPDLVKRAAELLLVAEPILACRLAVDANPPCWETAPALAKVVEIACTEDEYERLRYASLNAANGPQVSVNLLQDENGSRLRIKITHAVTDGAGALGIIMTFASIYSSLIADSSYIPEPNTHYDREGLEILQGVGRKEYLNLVWDFVKFYAPRVLPIRTRLLSLPDKPGSPPAYVLRQIAPDRVAFLAAYGKARGASLNDVLLSALARALAGLEVSDRRFSVRIAITVSLRRRGQRRNSIGNLSSAELLTLRPEVGEQFDTTLNNVRAFSRARLKSRPGLVFFLFGRLAQKHETFEKVARMEKKRSLRSARGQFPLVGNIGRLNKARLSFGGQAPVSAYLIPGMGAPRMTMLVSEYEGCLSLAVGSTEAAKPAAEAFFDAIVAQLPAPDSLSGLQEDVSMIAGTTCTPS